MRWSAARLFVETRDGALAEARDLLRAFIGDRLIQETKCGAAPPAGD